MFSFPFCDAYRQFYRQANGPEGARRFLLERLDRNQSVEETNAAV
jgi:hypothetical protein